MEIWFQDEARLGQKNGLTRLWARKGICAPASRPISAITTICSAPSVRLTARGRRSCCLGRTRKPCRCISTRSAATSPEGPCGCADGSGRMAHHRQTHPKNAAIARSGTERWKISGSLRANWLSNRVFEDYNAIVDAGCEAWNKLRTARNHHINRNAKMGPYRSMLNAVGIRRGPRQPANARQAKYVSPF